MTSSHTDSNWKLRYFSILFGQGLSLLGSSLTQFVLLWWITDSTGSVARLASAGIFALLPQAIFGTVGGTIADRHNRKWIMITADIVAAISVLGLVILFHLDRIELWHIYTAMIVRSSMHAFQQPAMNATIPNLVPTDFLPRAAGMTQTISGIVLVGAAPLGAIAIAAMPVSTALLLDPITALLGIAPLAVFNIPQGKPQEKQRFVQDLQDGISFVWKHLGLRTLFGIIGFMTLVVVPAFTLVPLLVKEHFNGGASQVAFLQSLGGAGLIIGGAIVAIAAPKRKVRWFLNGFIVACSSVSLAGIAPADGIWIAGIGWALASVFYVCGRSPVTALLQLSVPNHLQGRVFALLLTIEAVSAPIGLALMIPIGEITGIRGLFIGMGFTAGFVTLLGYLSRSLLDLENSHPTHAAPTANVGPGT